MYQQNPSSSKQLSDDESVSENDYLMSVLNIVNGYCKINLVVPQINLFYSRDSLLPINAKKDNLTLNNLIHKSPPSNTPDSIADMLKNVVDLKSDKNTENSNENQLQLSKKNTIDEFKVYSKVSYDDSSDPTELKEEKKIIVSPRGKKKKNKYNKIENMSSSSNNLNLEPSTSSTHKLDQNVCTDYINQYGNEKLEDDELKSKQEQVRYCI